MTEITSRLSTALADRYRIERRLGEGGMARPDSVARRRIDGDEREVQALD